MRKLGADQVFDYGSATVVEDIIKAFRGRTRAGAIAIGNDSLAACIDIVAASNGSKFVAQASVNQPDEMPSSTVGWVSTGLSVGLNGPRIRIERSWACRRDVEGSTNAAWPCTRPAERRGAEKDDEF